MAISFRDLPRQMLGTRSDWRFATPSFALPKRGTNLVGPGLILVSVALAWLPMRGAVGEDGNVTYGLWVGATSITLMAWSFLLAVRIVPLEPLFGGLDRMYRVHRWTGTLAVGAMYLHTSAEPEIEDGIRGASKSLADSAQGLAGTGETMIYILVGISLIRWFPYRWWRLTHKVLGIPFGFACFHFFTAEKPYANGSAWGWYFGAIMVTGLVAYLARVVVRDMFAQGARYRVSSATVSGGSLDLQLQPQGGDLTYEAGQFAVLKVQRDGLREPHIFTIASPPGEPGLRFFIRDLGDWTASMQRADLDGAEVFVEGPYGRFEPTSRHRRAVWIAGGVGITPFLSATGERGPSPADERPVLFYCVSRRADAMALDVLEAAHDEGRIELHVLVSSEGNRFGAGVLDERFGPGGLRDSHVAVCGPTALVAAADRAARMLGATDVERENFDIRQGFGPDLHIP